MARPDDDLTPEQLAEIEANMKQAALDMGAEEGDFNDEPTFQKPDGGDNEDPPADPPPGDNDDEPGEYIDDDEDPGDSDDDDFMTAEEHEAQARADGWTPREEFEANPKNKGKEWFPADEFNRRKPLIEKISRQSKAMKSMSSKMEQMEAKLNNLAAGQSKVLERAAQEELADLKSQRSAAIQAGDEQKVDALDEMIAKVKEGYSFTDNGGAGDEDDPGDQPGKQQPPQLSDTMRDWMKDNPWFYKNQDMFQRAGEIEAEMLKDPDNDLEEGSRELLDAVSDKIRAEYPHKFRGPRRQRNGPGNSGKTPRGEGGDSKKTYNDLPAEAKKICDNFVKLGTTTREQYVAEYFG